MKKGIGVGIEDFKKIIEEDCYYFDKTNYIEELLKDRTEIKLFTRPRRFGYYKCEFYFSINLN